MSIHDLLKDGNKMNENTLKEGARLIPYRKSIVESGY